MVTLVFSCAPNPPGEFQSLTEQQPKVLASEPAADSILSNPAQFALHFSQRVDIQSISAISVALIHKGWQEDFLKDQKQLVDSLQEEEVEVIPLNYELEGEEKILHLSPQIPLEDGHYHLVVTPRLSSITGIPFNQSPGNSPQAFFTAYTVGDAENLEADPSEIPEIQFGPAPEFLVINEILYDGATRETDGESFIELFGTPGADISAYTIALVNGDNGETIERILLPAESLLDEQGLFVIADLRTNSTQSTKVSHYNFLDQFDPQNGPDGIQLFDRHGTLLDAMCYGEGSVDQTLDGLPLCEGDPAPDVVAGHSLSRQSGLDTQRNHLDFFENKFPSPGNP